MRKNEKERPILFSNLMVNAILKGKKTMTRRVIKPQPIYTTTMNDIKWYSWKDRMFTMRGMQDNIVPLCPYGGPGDLAWVRETWRVDAKYDQLPPSKLPKNVIVDHAASLNIINESLFSYPGRWRLPRFMPRWASRMTLKIASVRIEHLQDISDEDAIAEGIERVGGKYSCNPWKNYLKGKPGEMLQDCSSPTRSFQTLWDSINFQRGYSWEVNPLVWVIEFKII
jgi:hypothetical protein